MAGRPALPSSRKRLVVSFRPQEVREGAWRPVPLPFGGRPAAARAPWLAAGPCAPPACRPDGNPSSGRPPPCGSPNCPARCRWYRCPTARRQRMRVSGRTARQYGVCGCLVVLRVSMTRCCSALIRRGGVPGGSGAIQGPLKSHRMGISSIREGYSADCISRKKGPARPGWRIAGVVPAIRTRRSIPWQALSWRPRILSLWL